MNSRNGGVVFESVTKRYGKDVVAVDDLSLEVNQGEFFTLLGPSGSGKTTLLNIVLGAVEPDAGEVFLAGRPITGIKINQRNVGMVFQNYALFPHMTVSENIAFPLRMRGLNSRAISARVDEMLELLQLPGYGNRYPRQLSGGQQQRVATARALAAEPPVVLMDEPLGALDVKLRLELQEQLRMLQQRLGLTVIYVTHDQTEAMVMSDRIGVMDGGRLQQLGTPRGVYETPANTFVAGFLGAANLLEVTLGERNGTSCSVRSTGGLEFTGMVPDGGAGAAEQRAWLMVRPSAIEVLPRPGGDDAASGGAVPENECLAIVQQVFFSGTIIKYVLRSEGWVLAAETPSKAGNQEFGVGDQVRVRWPASDTRVLLE